MEDIQIETVEWQAPEYPHKERTTDFLWAIGLVTLVGGLIALWFHNYIFAIFIFISGACLIMFSLRPPQYTNFAIKTEGFKLGKENHPWKSIKGFAIKKGGPYSKILIETSRYFLPVYTISIPSEKVEAAKAELDKVIEGKELEESRSMVFAEKIGF